MTSGHLKVEPPSHEGQQPGMPLVHLTEMPLLKTIQLALLQQAGTGKSLVHVEDPTVLHTFNN